MFSAETAYTQTAHTAGPVALANQSRAAARTGRPLKSLIAVAAVALALGGCANSGYGPKQTVGGLGGAAVGGLLGSQVGGGTGQLAATAIGVLAGAFIGSEVGRSLDDVDKLKAQKASYKARSAPIGETISWNNPNSGNYGSVTPVREGTSSKGRYCREFQQTITVGGEIQSGYGTACRQPDGSWEIL
ncbi:MAG: RT0821/Lpp0805 family surface protein [Pseudomonadota bacterium]